MLVKVNILILMSALYALKKYFKISGLCILVIQGFPIWQHLFSKDASKYLTFNVFDDNLNVCILQILLLRQIVIIMKQK